MGNEDQIREGLLMSTVNVRTEVFLEICQVLQIICEMAGDWVSMQACKRRFVRMCAHRQSVLFFTQNGEKYLFNKFPKFIFVKKLYIFRAVPLPIIRSFPLYVRHWYMSRRFDGSFQAWEVMLQSHHQTCMTYTSAECTVENF